MKEDDIQIALVEWLRAVKPDCIWWHTPNSGKVPIQYRMKLGRMGLRPGVPDLTFCGMMYQPVAFVELKIKTGRQSDTQKAFEADCKRKEIPYMLLKSSDPAEAVAKLEGFLKAWGAM